MVSNKSNKFRNFENVEMRELKRNIDNIENSAIVGENIHVDSGNIQIRKSEEVKMIRMNGLSSILDKLLLQEVTGAKQQFTSFEMKLITEYQIKSSAECQDKIDGIKKEYTDISTKYRSQMDEAIKKVGNPEIDSLQKYNEAVIEYKEMKQENAIATLEDTKSALDKLKEGYSDKDYEMEIGNIRDLLRKNRFEAIDTTNIKKLTDMKMSVMIVEISTIVAAIELDNAKLAETQRRISEIQSDIYKRGGIENDEEIVSLYSEKINLEKTINENTAKYEKYNEELKEYQAFTGQINRFTLDVKNLESMRVHMKDGQKKALDDLKKSFKEIDFNKAVKEVNSDAKEKEDETIKKYNEEAEKANNENIHCEDIINEYLTVRNAMFVLDEDEETDVREGRIIRDDKIRELTAKLEQIKKDYPVYFEVSCDCLSMDPDFLEKDKLENEAGVEQVGKIVKKVAYINKVMDTYTKKKYLGNLLSKEEIDIFNSLSTERKNFYTAYYEDDITELKDEITDTVNKNLKNSIEGFSKLKEEQIIEEAKKFRKAEIKRNQEKIDIYVNNNKLLQKEQNNFTKQVKDVENKQAIQDFIDELKQNLKDSMEYEYSRLDLPYNETTSKNYLNENSNYSLMSGPHVDKLSKELQTSAEKDETEEEKQSRIEQYFKAKIEKSEKESRETDNLSLSERAERLKQIEAIKPLLDEALLGDKKFGVKRLMERRKHKNILKEYFQTDGKKYSIDEIRNEIDKYGRYRNDIKQHNQLEELYRNVYSMNRDYDEAKRIIDDLQERLSNDIVNANLTDKELEVLEKFKVAKAYHKDELSKENLNENEGRQSKYVNYLEIESKVNQAGDNDMGNYVFKENSSIVETYQTKRKDLANVKDSSLVDEKCQKKINENNEAISIIEEQNDSLRNLSNQQLIEYGIQFKTNVINNDYNQVLNETEEFFNLYYDQDKILDQENDLDQ